MQRHVSQNSWINLWACIATSFCQCRCCICSPVHHLPGSNTSLPHVLELNELRCLIMILLKRRGWLPLCVNQEPATSVFRRHFPECNVYVDIFVFWMQWLKKKILSCLCKARNSRPPFFFFSFDSTHVASGRPTVFLSWSIVSKTATGPQTDSTGWGISCGCQWGLESGNVTRRDFMISQSPHFQENLSRGLWAMKYLLFDMEAIKNTA